MKGLLFTALIILLGLTVQAQNNDRRGFKDKITASEVATLDAATNEVLVSTEESTDIVFDGRNITIGNDVYEIVTREYDGKSTNTFKTTKRRNTFVIKFIPGTSVTVIDESNDAEITVYKLD
ncbi:MAG: hypothetical protein RLQ12_07620 [Cyclobacteriaceae bacterium]